MIIIYNTFFGSHLYGLATPQSDIDFRSVFIPNPKDILLGRVKDIVSENVGPKYHANGPGDVDNTLFSLKTFVNLLCDGDTGAFDMLHAPENKTVRSSDIASQLYKERSKFYTSQMTGLFNHVAKKSEAYGVRGIRATALKELVDVMKQMPDLDGFKLGDIVHRLPVDGEFLELAQDVTQKAGCQDFYVVLGRKFQFTISAIMFRDAVNKLWAEYGDRTKKIQMAGGVDWKDLSHAFRVGYQMLDIYREGDYTFPLKQTQELMLIKTGQVNFEEYQAKLQALVVEVKDAAAKSGLPKEVDRDYWEEFVVDTYHSAVQRWDPLWE